ncbi:MAG: TIGR04282 family arsenosugar biosynthesis glycosyltransferase [Halofilum sp. (in: g-proteobacteria)]|nr:TIGR04282 family arsenosugar biosynthesis glycosyltransferase [Halofilum sp. (in: g-proteobacteria)]
MASILVFARAPVPGRAKTRLIPALGAEGAARLHRALVNHALGEAAAAGAERLELWAAGDDAAGELAALAAAHGARLRWQAGADLGARMQAALADAVGRGGPALVVGTDCPWLDTAAIDEALARLVTHDAVLGPADDGGYVLLGLHRVEPVLFDGLPWGTERVLDVTRDRLAGLGWCWHELTSRGDIDRPGDLERLRALGPPWSGLLD